MSGYARPLRAPPVPVPGGSDLDWPIDARSRAYSESTHCARSRPHQVLLMALVAEVPGQLDLHRPPAAWSTAPEAREPNDLLLSLGAGERLVEKLVRQRSTDFVRRALKEPAWGAR